MKTRIILTIGTNELPCVVAGRRLFEACRERDGEAPGFLVLYSNRRNEEGKERMERVRAVIEDAVGAQVNWKPAGLNPYDPQNIYATVLDCVQQVPSPGAYHLHYSGGTAAMAAHSMEALLENRRNSYVVESSYLDPGSRRLRSRTPPSLKPLTFPNDERPRWAHLNLEDIVHLRGYQLCIREKEKSKDADKIDPPSAAKVQLGCESWQRRSVDESAPQPPGFRTNEDFELFVYAEMCAAMSEVGIASPKVYHSVHFRKFERDCELDIVALLGYEVIAISVTTGTDKKRAMEVFLRARQLGGDQTRGHFVCRSVPGEDAKLEDDISYDIGSSDRQIRVWGREHLSNLCGELAKYIEDPDKGLGVQHWNE